MGWSESQQIAIAIGPKITSIFSVMGSSYILQDIFRSHDLRHRPFHRIMAGLSISDVICSSSWFMSSWPIPKEAEGIYGNVGNTQTCSAQGFFNQLGGTSSFFYNGVLAAYYFLILRCEWREDRFLKIEKFLHFIPISFGLSTAAASLGLKLFNNANAWCWIAPYPAGCQESYSATPDSPANCTRGDNASIFRLAFWYGPLWGVIIWVILSMVLVYWKVLSVYRQMEQYGHNMGRGTASGNARKVANQAFFYVMAFLLTWIIPTIVRALQSRQKEFPFGVMIVFSMIIPFQGFLNALVYLRPRLVNRFEKQRRGRSSQISQLSSHHSRSDVFRSVRTIKLQPSTNESGNSNPKCEPAKSLSKTVIESTLGNSDRCGFNGGKVSFCNNYQEGVQSTRKIGGDGPCDKFDSENGSNNVINCKEGVPGTKTDEQYLSDAGDEEKSDRGQCSHGSTAVPSGAENDHVVRANSLFLQESAGEEETNLQHKEFDRDNTHSTGFITSGSTKEDDNISFQEEDTSNESVKRVGDVTSHARINLYWRDKSYTSV